MNIESPSSDALGQKAARGVLWSGAQIWGARAISFVIFALLSRLLDPQAFGLVAIASLLITFVQAFQDQGLGDAIVQRERLDPEHLDTAFLVNLLISLLLTAICMAVAPLVGIFFREPQLVPIVRWLSLSFPVASLAIVQQAILRRALAFKVLALRSILATLVGGIVGVAMALLGFGVWSLIAQTLVNALIGVLVLWICSSWRPGLRLSRSRLDELFRFGFNIVGMNLLNFANQHADDVLIGYFLGPTLLGFYTIAYKFFSVMMDALTTVTNTVALPAFARLQNDLDRLRRAFYKVIHFSSLISFPAFLGVAIVAPELVAAVFGPRWALSASVLRVLVFIGILHSVFYFHNSLVIALGKPSWRLGMVLLNAVSNVIAFAIAVRWGIVAVAAAYVIRGYLLSPLEIWMVRKVAQIDVRVYFRQFILPAIGSLAMTLAVLGLRYMMSEQFGLLPQLAAYSLAGGLVYLACLRLIEPSLLQQVLQLFGLPSPHRGLAEIPKP